jgi:hypothetical protein
MTIGLAVTWIGGLVFPVLVQLTLLSLLVHVVVQHKVAGHVLLISGWLLAVALNRSLVVAPWLRYTTMPSYTWSAGVGFGGTGPTLAAWTAYWTLVALTFALLAAHCWRRLHLVFSSSCLLVF